MRSRDFSGLVFYFKYILMFLYIFINIQGLEMKTFEVAFYKHDRPGKNTRPESNVYPLMSGSTR
jgi:hypothetical protein